jgi:hypothetical protein
MKKTIIALAGIISMTVIIVSAHVHGINGVVTSSCVGVIALIAGSVLGFSIGKKEVLK